MQQRADGCIFVVRSGIRGLRSELRGRELRMQPTSLRRYRFFLRWVFLSTLIAIALCSLKTFAETKVITDEDKDNSVQIKLGDTLEVRLQSNPSTGYMWYVHPKSTQVLKLLGQKQTEATEPGAGRPIVQIFTFEPRRKGDGILLLRYVRAWEKPMLGEEQFTVNVVIE